VKMLVNNKFLTTISFLVLCCKEKSDLPLSRTSRRLLDNTLRVPLKNFLEVTGLWLIARLSKEQLRSSKASGRTLRISPQLWP
jgi:hypothetical protein